MIQAGSSCYQNHWNVNREVVLMGRMDTMTKEYPAHNDVFADAFNYLIYDGRQVIHPETLRELDTTGIVLPYGTDQAAEAVQIFVFKLMK